MNEDLERAVQLLTPGRNALGKKESWVKHQAAALRACRKWLTHANTVGFGIGFRETRGRHMLEPSLRVHVLRKLPRSRLDEELIPPVLRLPGLQRPIAVDVVEGDIGRPQAAMCGDGVRLAGNVSFGTIACLVQRGSDPQIYALTCRHVLDGTVDTPVEWLEFPPTPLPPNPQIGTLALTSTYDTTPGFPNRIDLALVKLTPGAVDLMIRWLGRISGVRSTPLTVGEKVQLCGYGTSRLHTSDWDGVTQGEVKEISSRQTFEYPGVGALGLTELVLCTQFTADADSGAAVVDSENRLVGIHLGASGSNVSTPWSAFQPIDNVQLLFNLALVNPPAALESVSTLTSAAASQPGARPALPAPHRASAIDTMARTLWGEARGESPEGRAGIANVIANRALFAPPARFGGDVEAVCFQKGQFSCWNANDPNRPKLLAVTSVNPTFSACLVLAASAADGRLPDNTFGSRHYHEVSINPAWAVGHVPVVRLGHHAFYNDIP